MKGTTGRFGALGWRTRFAPAPTGHLHLGHVVNAIWVWGAARAFGGRVLLRIEDHDRLRSRAEYERSILADLAWLGFEPDDALVRQSEREALYSAALDRLAALGLVYPCDCTRREIADQGPAAEELRYPGTCRTRRIESHTGPMRRVVLAREEIVFDELRSGTRTQVPAEQCGDLLARDRNGNWTYQFAVTIDDLAQQVDVVVRGEDLLASTGRQIQLGRLLGRAAPARFLHHPLIRKADGSKLSKSSRDSGIRDLRASGWSAGRVLGAAAEAVGLVAHGRTLGVADLADCVGRATRALPTPPRSQEKPV